MYVEVKFGLEPGHLDTGAEIFTGAEIQHGLFRRNICGIVFIQSVFLIVSLKPNVCRRLPCYCLWSWPGFEEPQITNAPLLAKTHYRRFPMLHICANGDSSCWVWVVPPFLRSCIPSAIATSTKTLAIKKKHQKTPLLFLFQTGFPTDSS